MNPLRGKFITIEGLDGSGKTTQLSYLKKELDDWGVPCVITREPGGCPKAERLRQVALGEGDWCPKTELLLMMAARIHHIRDFIRPALDQGYWVLCDRFYDSTYAYQGAGRGIPKEAIDSLTAWFQENLHPDWTILLDLPAELSKQRIALRNQKQDSFDLEGLRFLNRVREGFLGRAKDSYGRLTVIDASKSKHEVRYAIRKAMESRFSEIVTKPESIDPPGRSTRNYDSSSADIA